MPPSAFANAMTASPARVASSPSNRSASVTQSPRSSNTITPSSRSPPTSFGAYAPSSSRSAAHSLCRSHRLSPHFPPRLAKTVCRPPSIAYRTTWSTPSYVRTPSGARGMRRRCARRPAGDPPRGSGRAEGGTARGSDRAGRASASASVSGFGVGSGFGGLRFVSPSATASHRTSLNRPSACSLSNTTLCPFSVCAVPRCDDIDESDGRICRASTPSFNASRDAHVELRVLVQDLEPLLDVLRASSSPRSSS